VTFPVAKVSESEAELYRVLSRMAWRSHFDAQSVARGEAYAASARVSPVFEVERQGELLLLSGEVSGQGRRPYATRVAVSDRREPAFALSDCSCPVGSQCKHGVALIQTFLLEMEAAGLAPAGAGADSEARLEQAWRRWLDGLAQSSASLASPTAVEEERTLGLFLRIDDRYDGPRLKVLPVWLRPSRGSKRHKLVDPVAVELTRHGLVPAPAAGWPTEQEPSLLLLLQGETWDESTTTRRMPWVSVARPYQANALWRLLEGEAPPVLFHAKQTGAPLVPGPARAYEVAWQADDQGMQHLGAYLQGERELSADLQLGLAGTGLCYLDPGSGVFGPVEGDPELLRRLAQAPPLPVEKSAWLAEQMQQAPSLPRSLTPPPVLQEETLVDVAPRLRVQMEVMTVDLGDWAPDPHELGCGVVWLDYGEIAITPEQGESARVVHEGRLVTVQRDPQAELALIQSLPRGMVTLERLAEDSGMPDVSQPPWTLLLPIADALPRFATEWPERLALPDEWWPMVERLRAAGVAVGFADDFPPEPERLHPEAWYGELEPAGNGWFDLALDIELEGERLNLLPILRQLLEDPEFPLEPPADEPPDATHEIALDDDRRLVLPLARLRALMAPILDWLEGGDDASLALPVTAAGALDALARQEQWQGRENLSELAERLAALPTELPAPAGFQGELRPYQARGLAWLRFLAELEVGGILADDMGLGKTVQVLAHVLDERARGALDGPVLVVAPTSLVGNWCAEAARFCPEWRVLALQGPRKRRQALWETLDQADLVVTTYALMQRDLAALKAHDLGLLVLDEAQAIKNAASQTARAVRELEARRTLAMTGTPLENHLGELWAQLDAVAPGVLGSAQWFGRHFRRPIEREGDSERRRQLSRRIAPLMLRRTKDQVLTELPEKTETRREVELSGAQRELYESLRLAQHQRVQQSIAERGLSGSGIVMLDALLKLRQVCCDPRLVKLDSARKIQRSAKLDQLRELLPPLIEEGRRILVFSQFTEMLALIGKALEHDGIAFATLTGETPGEQRTQRVTRFQQGEVPVFLISLKAGGVGLNLTAADTVIHYDPWWNPAVEAQATGRAHRLGQQNPVFVYKLVCAGTVEERITELQARKAELATSILECDNEGTSHDGPLFDEHDLEHLFAPVGSDPKVP